MSEDITTVIRSLLQEVRDGTSFEATSVDADFGDIGLDSLDISSLLLAVQEHFDIEISDEVADDLTTIRLLSDYISSQKSA